ncbi:MAG: hypothetical protein KC466_07490 [Myxococcales bacterium]|nr:hypothetical protein [Myxococcales bacterium]
MPHGTLKTRRSICWLIAAAASVAVGCDGNGPRNGRAIAPPDACPSVVRTDPPELPDPVPTKFSLGIFHYNLQYVAGAGEANEDLIITEAIAPIVELFERHPNWGINLEMQGLAVEAIAARHPDLLARLRALVESGQIDLTSVHYSDQLFIAFPRVSMERSWEIQEEVFAASGLRAAPAIFAQEGQWAEGILPFLAERCLGTMVLARNQYRWQYGEPAQQPWFERDGYPVVVGPGNIGPGHPSGIELDWSELDDGEILPTGGFNPYFEPLFRRNDASIAAYEAELQDLEDRGFWVTTITKYVAALKALGVEPSPLPLVTDGTWQPQSTFGTSRWLGGAGLLFFLERDNAVRTANYRSRNALVAAETAVAAAERAGHSMDAARESIRQGWRDQVLGEVSDASGINPIPVEWDYGLAHAAEAERLAQSAIDDAKARLGIAEARIDTRAGTVVPAPAEPIERFTPTGAPLDVTVDAPGRPLTVRWFTVDGAPNTYELRVELGAATGLVNPVTVGFPRSGTTLAYSPALLEDRVQEIDLTAFAYGENWLALANGLIGIGDDWWVIKDASSVHVVAHYGLDRPQVSFEDQVANERDPVTWRFRVLRGDAAAALAAATRLNTWPTLDR